MSVQSALTPVNVLSMTRVLSPLFPATLPKPRTNDDNAIDYRNIFLLGAQNKGKTTTAQAIALLCQSRYGATKFFLQIAGIDRLLTEGVSNPAKCWVLCAEDMTLARIKNTELNRFFQVRHLIREATGLREGIAVTILNSHTFHGLNKNLRDTFDALIIKSVPTNPYDRSILKRYFTPTLLDQFERNWAIDGAIVWTPFQNRGVRVRVIAPENGAIVEQKIKRSIWAILHR